MVSRYLWFREGRVVQRIPGLVNIQKNYGNSPFIVSFPMKKCDFP